MVAPDAHDGDAPALEVDAVDGVGGVGAVAADLGVLPLLLDAAPVVAAALAAPTCSPANQPARAVGLPFPLGAKGLS